MFNFSKIFDSAENYISHLGVIGGIGGIIGLYSLGGIRNTQALMVIGAASVLPPLVLRNEGAANELLMDMLIVAGPVGSMYMYDMLDLNNVFYFAIGALTIQAIASTLRTVKRK